MKKMMLGFGEDTEHNHLDSKSLHLQTYNGIRIWIIKKFLMRMVILRKIL